MSLLLLGRTRFRNKIIDPLPSFPISVAESAILLSSDKEPSALNVMNRRVRKNADFCNCLTNESFLTKCRFLTARIDGSLSLDKRTAGLWGRDCHFFQIPRCVDDHCAYIHRNRQQFTAQSISIY